MASYTVSHQTAAGTDLGIINLESNVVAPARVFEWVLGSDDTPADVAGEWVLNRTTTVGVGGTALTENKPDPLSLAPGIIAHGGTWSTNPVDTANSELYMLAMNQRATFRWVASPGMEFISAAIVEQGLFFRTVAMSSGTPNMNMTIMWRE